MFTKNQFLFFLLVSILCACSLQKTVSTAENKPFPYIMFKPMPLSIHQVMPEMLCKEEPIPPHQEYYDDNGFRNSNKSECVDVVFLGASLMHNGEPIDKTIPLIIQKKLLEKNIHINCLNLSVVSFNSFQEYLTFVLFGKEKHPKLVVQVNGINDITLPLNYDPRIGYPYNFFVWEAVWPSQQKKQDPDIIRKKLMSENTRDIDKTIHDVIKNYLRNIETTKQLLESMQIKYLLYFQPDILDKQRTAQEERISGSVSFQNYLQMAKNKFKTLPSPTPEFWKIKNNFSSVKEEIFWDYIHTNNRGNQIISEIISDDIVNKLKNDRPN